MTYTHLAVGVRRFLSHPARVATFCFAIFLVSIVLNGNLFRLWGLYRDHDRISANILEMRQNILNLAGQLKQAKDPNFIERQARDKLDLAGEHDLVFVFPD
jgi:cell division protein FtsB